MYPLLQLYVAMLWYVVVVNILDPPSIVGGVPQSTTANEYTTQDKYIHVRLHVWLLEVITTVIQTCRNDQNLTWTSNVPSTPCSIRLTYSRVHCITRQFISSNTAVCSCSSLQSRRGSWTVCDDSIGEHCKVITGCCNKWKVIVNKLNVYIKYIQTYNSNTNNCISIGLWILTVT